MARGRKEKWGNKIKEEYLYLEYAPTLSPHYLYIEPSFWEKENFVYDLAQLFDPKAMIFDQGKINQLKKKFEGLSFVNVPEKYPTNKVGVINIHRDEGYAGVFTTSLGDCSCLSFVQLDDNDRPERISAFHFSGGLDTDSLSDWPNLLVKLLEGFDPTRPLTVVITDGLTHGHQGKGNVRLERSGRRSEIIKSILREHDFNIVGIQRTYGQGVLLTFEEINELITKPKSLRKR